MNIGILTWYKSLNHGAVLQAYATQNYLRDKGYEAVLIDYDRQVKDQRSLLFLYYQRLKKLLNGELKDRNTIHEMDLEKKVLFKSFIDSELKCGDDYNKERYDNIIIGSDMVFSLIQGFNPYMFGIGLNTNKIFSYAASAGGSKIELARKMKVDDQIKNGLLKFSGIGYRDQETLDFVKSFNINIDCVENIDPVLLYGFEKEKKAWDTNKWLSQKAYVLIYAYHGFMNSKQEVNAIKSFAKKNGLRIISCGYYHSWCDENVNADPKEFLEMFIHASYIITDTFHGTVFSIINKKRFVSIIRDNSFKVKYLLDKLDLENRIASSSNEIETILEKPVAYEISDKLLEFERKKSENYLLRMLMKGIDKCSQQEID